MLKWFLAVLVLLIAAPSVYAAPSDWPMTAATPERTSWVTDAVPGVLKPVWYRPIDPYIDPNTQVIATGGKLFVSTSKGLYAFDANSGNQLWVYGTEMPLGNSPTVVNGVAYAPGFDRKIHAINTTSGQAQTGYTPFVAGAGFDTNPIVVNNTIYAGNRDGKFYALNATTGAKVWEFQTGGPIHYSAAYKNGVLYFASDDSYAYAVNAANGTQVWKSVKMPGVGFDMYWPVIYTDTYPSSPTVGKDYVIFQGSMKGGWNWLYGGQDMFHQDNYSMFSNQTGYCGPEGTENYLWPSGTKTLKCDVVFNWYNNNPKWGGNPPDTRITFVLDRNTGVEKTPYPPFNPTPHDGGSQGYRQPPIVDPSTNVLYQFTGYTAKNSDGSVPNGGARGGIVGWKFGTEFIARTYDFSRGYGDEPTVYTGGGNLIYYGEGVNIGFGTISLAAPAGQNSFWQWDDFKHLNGAVSKYTSWDLWGKFGGSNGQYSYMDGVLSQSPIPYNGRIYMINGNVLFSLSASGNATAPLPTATAPSNVVSAVISENATEINQKLEQQVSRIIAAGHLRPGFHESGQVNGANVFDFYPGTPYYIPGRHLLEYYHNPGETQATLALALPYLSPALQAQTKAYMQAEESAYPVETYASVGWKNGAKREVYDDLGDVAKAINGQAPYTYIDVNPATTVDYRPQAIKAWDFPPYNFYGAWKYVQVFPNEASRIFNAMKSKLPVPNVGNDMTDANLLRFPYLLNQYVAGYRGYVEMDKTVNNLSSINQSSKYPEYQRLLNLRLNNFDENSPFGDGFDMNNSFNIARNFMFMTPELAAEMRANPTVYTKIQSALPNYQKLGPYWFVAKYHRSYAESYAAPLFDYQSIFQARAWILKEPFSELVKYIDVPAFQTGDLYYIQNLTAALSQAGTIPSPTPTQSPIKDGNVDGVGGVDALDLKAVIANYIKTVTNLLDQYPDNKINAFDFVVVLKRLP